MRQFVLGSGCLALLAVTSLVPNTTRAAESVKLETAAVVVEGKVQAIYHDEPATEEPVISYLIQIVVTKVEKASPGDGPKPGKVLYAGTYRIRKVPGKPVPGAMFAAARPSKGDTVRLFCFRTDDGAYQILMNPEAIRVIELAKNE
jgi:hypothetical protein